MADAPTGKVTFVGAGPGAADLLTFRAARAIAEADVVIWAASLVQAEVLDHAREGAEILDSATMSLEDVVAVYERAREQGLRVARIHSGDPALWGGTQEQMDRCAELGIATEIVPGVSSFSAVAALAGRELTIPEVAQSVILTRLGGGKTPMPPGEEVRSSPSTARRWRCSCRRPAAASSYGSCSRAVIRRPRRSSSPTRRPGRRS